MAKRGKRIVKYPTLHDVEYVSITKNRNSVFEMNDCAEIEGMTRREFQIFLGTKLPEGIYNHSIKFRNEAEPYKGTIRIIKTGIKELNTLDDSKVLKQFADLKATIEKQSSQGGITYDMLLSNVKTGYDTQINFLNQQITFKDNQIQKLESEVDDLENELDKCEKSHAEIEKKAGWVGLVNQYKPLIEAGLMKLGAKGTPKLSGNIDINGIPQEVLEILGTIDYVELKKEDEKYQQMLGWLRMAVSKLPQKQ